MPNPQDPDKVRRVVRMKEVEKLSYAKIAAAVGTSRVAVRLLYLRWRDHPCARGGN